ncbi:MAG: hypothetical protein WKF70_03670 [Chitinophagaceae bacterium]
MSRFLVIGFDFCDTYYYSLVNCKPKPNGTEYRLTVMNGDLEKLLYGTNTLQEINGCLYFDVPETKEQKELKIKIVQSLSSVLGVPFRKVSTKADAD